MVIRVTYILLLSLLFGCVSVSESETEMSTNHPQYPVEVSYAKYFSIDTIDGFQRIKVIDPVTQQGQYFWLVPKGMNPELNGVIISTPVDDLSLFSVSFIGFLEQLDALSNVKYIENINYVYNEEIIQRYNMGIVKESGIFGQMDLEKLILDAPELLLLNDFPESSNYLNKLLKAEVSYLPIVEWQEEEPLARAEWIKVIGALLDKEKIADSVFQEIEKNYLDIKSKCSIDGGSVKVIFSSLYEGVWYMPGGKSYIANLLTDANGRFEWSNNNEVGSIAVSFEEVLLNSSKNDVWINPDADSKNELVGRDGRYQVLIDSLTLGVFQANARKNQKGGNDYWESGVVRPDLILSDYAKMLHPKKFEEIEFYFFQELE
ncbi:MAG: ABC transporter substrate-binding protein [Flavobacteriales bacterium]|nr:ABC transporter substrate-binding protein [Flavobacteriales bacterium]